MGLINDVEAVQVYNLVQINMILYYLQTFIDIIIVCSINLYQTARNMRQSSYIQIKIYSHACKIFIVMSALVNFYNVYELYKINIYVHKFKMELIFEAEKESKLYKFAVWYKLCYQMYEARRYFWIALILLMIIVLLIFVIFKTIYYVFVFYES